MEPLRHDPDDAHDAHVAEARRVLELPVAVSGLRWHPFGVYTVPLPKRSLDGATWSRRLHLWHPAAEPVGEASPYGVHTHSGTARSHVLAGTLQHHLYDFEETPDGTWEACLLGEREWRSDLLAHAQAPTAAGTTHTLPAHQPHAVSRPGGWAVSLFEQMDTPDAAFVTYRRGDLPLQELVRTPPVPVRDVQREALVLLDAVSVSFK